MFESLCTLTIYDAYSPQKEDLMESQLKEATSANRDLMQALAEKEEEVGRLSNIEREYTELKHASNGDLEKVCVWRCLGHFSNFVQKHGEYQAAWR